MKRIGLYLGLDPGLGAFQYSQSMLDGVSSLPRTEFDPIIIYSSLAWEPYLKNLDIKAQYIPKSLPSRVVNRLSKSLPISIALWRSVARHLDSFSKAFINEHCDIWIFPAQDSWAYLLPVPALAAIHDLMHRYESRFPEVSENGKYHSREWHYKWVCRWSKGVLVDSNIGKEQVEESYGMQAEHIHILPYVPPKYIYSIDNPDDFDERYRLPMKYIFYPAQFWEHKNHRALIRAINALKSEFPDIRLVLVGSRKNAYKSCVELVKQLQLQERVIFLGYVPDEDMPGLYQRARAMVYPTFFGPTNIPPLEAFVTGCPAAVSNIYGMPEQVGDAALLFDPKSDQEITDVMRRLWSDDDLCADLSNRGKKRECLVNSGQFNDKLKNILQGSLT